MYISKARDDDLKCPSLSSKTGKGRRKEEGGERRKKKEGRRSGRRGGGE